MLWTSCTNLWWQRARLLQLAIGLCYSLRLKVVPSSKMCARSAGNESLNEMEYTCFRVGSSNRTHRNGWRPLDTTTVCKAFECWGRIVGTDRGWHHLEADPRHAQLGRKSFGVLADQSRHLESETDSLTSKERFRSFRLTKKRQIGVVRTRCVHSVSPVTDLTYRSSAVIWHARCNSCRT